MESNGDRDAAREQLDVIEQGELASWVAVPPTPRWWVPCFGLWAGALALSIGLLEGLAESSAELGLALVMVLVIVWDRRRRGTYPTGRPPRQFRRPMTGLVIGAVVTAAVAWVVGEQVGVWAAVVIAVVGSWAVVGWYEREYAAVAARIRERLA